LLSKIILVYSLVNSTGEWALMQMNNKDKRMQYLTEVIDKYMKTEPMLTEKDIAMIIVMQLGDITKFIKECKKEIKKELK
jgi:hypothetical protein